MSSLILATKLFIPPSRLEVIPRARLLARLNEGLGLNQGFARKLTLISAPAGFGKTTLASAWINSCEWSAAWLSLDERDNDLIRFLTYLIAALQTIAAQQSPAGTFGKGVLAMLQSSQPLTIEPVLTVLLNEITTIPDNFILVLDDYHVIDAESVDTALTFLLTHMPPQMHLVITTREDPQLPLARLRGRGQLTEVRAADLRFTLAETAVFLNQVMGLTLTAEDIAAMETRTEGWIAGLQMAGLSMQGHADAARFIQTFTGSHHFILDYLVEEVLQRQPKHVRNFLLQTAILHQLSGSLCEAVTGQKDSNGMLKALERGNLFVVPLDDQRQWYRYHHLFADALQAHAMEKQPQQMPSLHLRASEWYAQHGLLVDAIRHVLAAEDFEQAASLIELVIPTMESSFEIATWLGWVKILPEALIHVRPVLSVGYGWALLESGEMEASEAHFQNAEQWLDLVADRNEHPERLPTEMVVADKARFWLLPSSIATARAYRALALGNISDTVMHAQEALDLLPEGNNQWHGGASTLLGLAQYASGDLEAANRTLVDFMTHAQQAEKLSDVISITFILADLRIVLGRLHEAFNTYQQSLLLAAGPEETMILGTADLFRGLSELYRERDDLEAAKQYLQQGEMLGKQAALPNWPSRLYLAQAELKKSQGDLDGALDLIEKAERLHIRTPLPTVRPLAALKTRLWIAQGRLADAWNWAWEQNLTVADDLSFLREFDHITLARVLIAQYRSDKADGSIQKGLELLARLLEAAETGGRMGSVIEILMLQALAHKAKGDITRAMGALERALTLAEPEGYIRIFVDEGPPIIDLLQEAKNQGITPNYLNQLYAAGAKTDGKTTVSQPLIEPLSKRELEVLKLLGSDLSGPDIARELMVSLNTMRSHTKNIYSKLGVNSRRMAVRRAEELGLL
ncbi:MAG TPA: LuxR C-terminal-related transcriptional regulator [Anaerolineae bacterium]|nr:LuxR C-terminal-related transcriptional regulator [Anaerolineae bacterium]